MLQETYLYREIYEQPAVLATVIEQEGENVARLVAAIRGRQITHVLIAGRGTSDNAGRYAQYLLGAVNGLSVALATPSLFSIYHRPPHLGNALVLGISQSGKSPDIVAVVAEAQAQGALTVALTNFPRSDLGQAAGLVLDLHAGEERSVAATKTYTAELATIALLSATLAADRAMLDTLREMPDVIAQTLAANEHVATVAERYRYMQHCVVIGRGYNYATAFELALKLKELTYSIVEPYSSADFMHGPLAVIDPGFPVILVAPSGAVLPELLGFAQNLQERGAELIVISDDPALLQMARTRLPLPRPMPEWVSPLAAIVPGQLFAMHLAAARDFDVDHPRGLRKVTRTR